MTELRPDPNVRDYTVPEGCPVCSADLPVRVSAAGPRGVCKHCGWMGKPVLTINHRGMRIRSAESAKA